MARWHRDPARGGTASAGAAASQPPPQPGQSCRVWLPAGEVAQDASLPLLWCPAFSEENGWDARPSDILSSEIVTGRIRDLSPSERAASSPPNSNELACMVAVESRVALVDCMRLAPSAADASARLNRDASLFWKHVGWCGRAEVESFTYLSAVSGETQRELILRRGKNTLLVHYEHHLLADWSEAAIGAWPLTDSQRPLIEALLRRADILTEPRPARDPGA